MKRIRSTLRLALPLALLLGATTLSTSVIAGDDKGLDWVLQDQHTNKDGSREEVYKERTRGWILDEKFDKNGYLIWRTINTYKPAGGDPAPDDPSSKGTGTQPPDVADLIKEGLITYKIRANPENTPLAQWIDREGGGAIPHWNPSDDSGKGPAGPPKSNTGGLTPKQLAEITKLVNFTAKSLAEIGGSMGDGYEGLAGESAPTPNKNNGSSGRGKGTGLGDGSGNYKNTHIGSGEATTLGPRPDLVNPAPKSKTGGSNLFAPGLLDTNTGFPGSSPAATGTPSRGIAPGTNLR